LANIATKARQTFDLTNSGQTFDVLENVIAGFVLFIGWTIFVYICIATGEALFLTFVSYCY